MKKTTRKLCSLLLAVLLLLPLLPTTAHGAEKYTLRYIFNGGDNGSVLVEANTEIAYLVINVIGKTFSGWLLEDGSPAPTHMPAGDLTVYGTTTPIPCTVSYVVDNVLREDLSRTYDYGQTIEFPTPERTGYSFSGWTTSAGAAPPEIVVENLTLVGSMVQNDYTLRYVLDDVPLDGEQVLHYDDPISYRTDYDDLTGTSFSGWKTEDGAPAPLTMPAADLTVYGTLERFTYTVSYYLNGGKLDADQGYHYGDTIRYLTTYNNIEGNTFSGWHLEDGSDPPVTMPTQDVAVYATLEANSYDVVYYLNQKPLTTQTYLYGNEIQYITDFDNIPDTTFSGWLLADGSAAPATMPARPLLVFGNLTRVPAAAFTGGDYKNVIQGNTVEIYIGVDAPYVKSVRLFDFTFDADKLFLSGGEWLVEGAQSAEWGVDGAQLVFAQNTNISGTSILHLTFEVASNAVVGTTDIGFSASVTTITPTGENSLKTTVEPARVSIVCGSHNFTGGEIRNNGNGTHGVYCANGCGIKADTPCAGGTATCLERAACTVCGVSYGFKKDHSYTGEARDNLDGTHSRLCVNGCGLYDNPTLCTYGAATANLDGTHTRLCLLCSHLLTEDCAGGAASCLVRALCADCGASYGEPLPHAYTGEPKANLDGTHVFLCTNGCGEYGAPAVCRYANYISAEAGNHLKSCIVCAYETAERCSGGTPGCQNKPACAHCGQLYGAVLAHEYVGAAKSDNNGKHTRQCINGCGLYGEETDCTPGEPLPNNDGTHARVCSACGYRQITACTGGEATCLQPAVCETCGAPHGEKLLHRYVGEAVSNGDGTHALLCVNGCGLGGTPAACTPGAWQFDGDNTHTRTCTECTWQETQDCTGGTATCDAQAVCDICEASYGDTPPHTFTEGVTANRDGTHTRYCSVCEKDVIEGCSGGSATCTSLADCAFCGEPYGDTLPHTFEYRSNPDGTHAMNCLFCDEARTEDCSGGTASCLSQASCAFCNTLYGERLSDSFTGEARDNGDGTHSLCCINGCGLYGEAIACTFDTPVFNGDDTHTATCTVCGAQTTNACTGGTATCQEKAICETCGGAYGDGGSHRYRVYSDETGHWSACVCGLRTETEAHAFGTPFVKIPATLEKTGERIYLCASCGYTVQEVIPRPWPAGDVDGDGRISAEDARLTLRAAVGLETLTPAQEALADVDGSPGVTAADARMLLRGSVGLEDPAAWGTVGLDNDGNLL